MKPASVVAYAAWFIVSGTSCAPPPDTFSPFSGAFDSLRIHVSYADGQVPLTGNGERGAAIWTMVQSNLQALLGGRHVNVPTMIDQMDRLVARQRNTWDAYDILDFVKQHQHPQRGNQLAVDVFFVEGLFLAEGKVSPQTMGLHIDGTSSVVIFKQAIAQAVFGSGAKAGGFLHKYLEQSTVVHELGHVFGLVNSGAPAVSSHEDESHANHCSNPGCIMFYENGRSDAVEFLQRTRMNEAIILFDEACLDDVKSALGEAEGAG